jgi:hypothetical protein
MTLNLANVWTSRRSDYVLTVTVVSSDRRAHDCARCGEPSSALVAYSRNEPTEGDERDFAEACLTCLVPLIDSIDYLNTDVPIDVEVDRNATARPF